MRSRVRVMACSTPVARTVSVVVCQTIVSLSPSRPGKPEASSREARSESVPGTP